MAGNMEHRYRHAHDPAGRGGAEMSEIVWTAREALACALCWAEFSSPERTGVSSPETCWLGLPAKTRDTYRREANQKLLLAVARGDAVAITSPHMFTPAECAAIGADLGIKSPARTWKIIAAVRNGAARRIAPDA